MTLVEMHVASPVVLIGALTFCLATWISHVSVFYRDLVNNEIAARRFHSVDGLRGYLALGVAFHHVTLNYEYYSIGEWSRAPTNLGAFLGKGSVALFFMITAFLFWNRALDTEGRFQTPEFYQSRLRRIVPMYLFAVLLLVTTALALSGPIQTASVLDLVKSILSWAFFTIPGEPAINGYENTHLINTVFWSLVWEWKFYLILPLLAIFSGHRVRWQMMLGAALLLAAFDDSSLGWFFWGGALAAMLTRFKAITFVLRTWYASLTAIGLVAAAIAYVPYAHGMLAAALLLIPFTIVSGGNTIFGLLTLRPARLLGILSYSVYLLHNWVVFVLSALANRFVRIAELSEIEYWLLGTVIVIATVALSSITYRFIESPYLKAKRGTRGDDAARQITVTP